MAVGAREVVGACEALEYRAERGPIPEAELDTFRANVEVALGRARAAFDRLLEQEDGPARQDGEERLREVS